MTNPVLLCLDSGTTAVKACAFDAAGGMLATAERQNGALRRNGDRVEQDMEMSRNDAFAVLNECAAKLEDSHVAAIIVTGQGDGLWPVDADHKPVGHAFTWLDGRCRTLVAELEDQGVLDEVRQLTGSRPTAASQSLQLLWLWNNDAARFARIRHALRLKEWLFLSLTGKLAAEPGVVLPVWGDWRTGKPVPEVAKAIGLPRAMDLIPELLPVGECQASLLAGPAAAIGVARDIPVYLGPGDVQATLIGLGLGSRPGVTRASIFGTSAIHACHIRDQHAVPSEPPGAMVQQFALGEGYLCFHPSFNGANTLKHLSQLTGATTWNGRPRYSNLILHPFLEPGGERAPVTSPFATGAAFGLKASTDPQDIAWAGREALAFVARKSHDMMKAPEGALSLGGGLAADAAFCGFLATLLKSEVQRSSASHAGLKGLGAIAAKYLFGASPSELGNWIGEPDERIAPATGNVSAYAEEKYDLFCNLLDVVSPHWQQLASLTRTANNLLEEDVT